MNDASAAITVDASTADVSRKAAQWEPAANIVLGGLAIYILGESIGEPIVSSLSSSGWYPMETALVHVRNNLIEAAPAFALLWGLATARAYLARLRRGHLWLASTQTLLIRLAAALVLAGLLGLAARPVAAAIAGADIRFSLDAGWLALIGVGALTAMVGRVMQAVVEAALALKRENDEIL